MECKICKEAIVTNREPYISLPLYPYETNEIEYLHAKCMSDSVWIAFHNHLSECLMFDIRVKNVTSDEFNSKQYNIKLGQQDHMEWCKKNNTKGYERLVELGWQKGQPWWESRRY